MEFELLGAVSLGLSHEQFAYAGKFVMTNTEKVVARESDESGQKANARESDKADKKTSAPESGESGQKASAPESDKADEIIAAAAFNQDYSTPACARVRYVTVREDRRGEGIGPQLLEWTAEQLQGQFESVAIAVNNPIAYQACHRAGFVWTGEETGIAELRMRYAPEVTDPKRYQDGLAVFQGRELPPEQAQVLKRNAEQR